MNRKIKIFLNFCKLYLKITEKYIWLNANASSKNVFYPPMNQLLYVVTQYFNHSKHFYQLE